LANRVKFRRRWIKPFDASRGLATVVAVLVVIIIILVAGLGYTTLMKSSTVTSVITTTASAASASTNTSIAGCNSTPLLLYTADAYPLEVQALASNFTASTCIPAVLAQEQGAGADAALIAAGDPVSVFLSINKGDIESAALGPEYPGWAVSFASDEMAIAYSSASTTGSAAQAVLTAYKTASSSNTSSAWYTFFNDLTSGSVKVGISNPNLDPAGFRGWMVLQLAGIAYGSNGTGGPAYSQTFVNGLLKNDANVTGSSAAALIPSLATGQINFLFIYKSDVASNGLSMLQLPNEVNLGEVSYDSFYKQASYTLTTGVETGAAIALWLSVPSDATNPTGAVQFVVYTVKNYQTVLKSFGLTPIIPAQLYADSNATVPSTITALETNGTLTNAGSL
jgi:molybdate/tungstate transport system substrate-binding protein